MAICDKCKQNPASIHIVRVVNGKKTVQKLCRECAIKDMKNTAGDMSVDKLLAGMMKLNNSKNAKVDLICPVCGTTFEKFSSQGRVGCANCYKEFRPYINQMLIKAQKGLEHTGKHPHINKDENDDRINRLRVLRGEMRDAIDSENFEKAAVLRDKIAQISVSDNDE